jgi:hypothetical protein
MDIAGVPCNLRLGPRYGPEGPIRQVARAPRLRGRLAGDDLTVGVIGQIRPTAVQITDR